MNVQTNSVLLPHMISIVDAFTSVRAAKATYLRDKEAILSSIETEFGAIEEADDLPHDVFVHAEVVVHDLVSHPDDVLPGISGWDAVNSGDTWRAASPITWTR